MPVRPGSSRCRRRCRRWPTGWRPGGSLLEAAAAAASARRLPGRCSPASTGGLARLAERLAAARSFQVRTSTPVRELRRTATGFELALGSAPSRQRLTADAVVVAVPAGKAAALLAQLAPVAAAELARSRPPAW